MLPDSDPATPPLARRNSDAWRIVILAVALFALLLTVNARHLLRRELHETGDIAANSLAVREAKAFRQIYGQYSRWGFRHPGPGWFYVFAAGEGLFYDTLHIVRAPLNGQLLILLAIESAFLAAAIGTAARWTRRKTLFVACVLLLAVMHFAAMGSETFLSNWTPHLMAIPFLTLLIAAASVAAGRGEDLPLLALSGGALLHSHVAQPLFVFPIGVAAYGGLFWNQRSAGRAPWRLFRKSHLAVLFLGLIFALPVLIDLSRGPDQNFALILRHLRGQKGQHHSWNAAISYVLHFGTYTPATGIETLNEVGDEVALPRFVAANWRTFSLWGVLGFLPLLAIAARLRQRSRSGGGAVTEAAQEQRRFLISLSAMVVMAFGLTTYWARIQDGPMFYFNAWFNYGIYFALAVLALIAVAQMERNLGWKRLPQRLLTMLVFCAAGGLFAYDLPRFQTHSMDQPVNRAIPGSVAEALRLDGGEGRGAPRFLSFPHDGWPAATGAALELERRGYHARVTSFWGTMFGDRLAFANPFEAAPGKSRAPVVWRFALTAKDPAGAGKRPIADGYGISVSAPLLNPANAPKLSFVGPADGSEATFIPYALLGWSQPPPGSPYTWSEMPIGVMSFSTVSLPAESGGVEILANIFPSLTTGKRERQRLALEWNETPLGEWEFTREEQLRVVVPAALWNSAAGRNVRLTWRLPDAISPAALGQSGDTREIAFGFREVAFRVLPSTAEAR